MPRSTQLHERFKLLTFPEEYVLEPQSDPRHATRRLRLSRKHGSIALDGNRDGPATFTNTALEVYGIFGIISLFTSDYIILITNRESRGQLDGHTIYFATGFEILPLNTEHSGTSSTESVDRHYLDLLKQHLDEGTFWFSYGWNLTKRLQAQATSPADDKAMWELADDRFFWNKHLQSKFIDITLSHPDQDLSPFILPVLYGSFDLQATSVSRHPFTFCLISRRSRYRAGTRYFSRGLDLEGHASNYNETEQMIFINSSNPHASYPIQSTRSGAGYGPQSYRDTNKMSFVQTRGGAPIGFAEINNLRYVPDLAIMDSPVMLKAFGLHVDEQVSLYGKQVFVNLVNSTGRERLVKSNFEQRIKEREEVLRRATLSAQGVVRGERVMLGGGTPRSTSLGGNIAFSSAADGRPNDKYFPKHGSFAGPNIAGLGADNLLQYYYFDFHKECSKMRFDRVSLLIDQLEENIQSGGYFHKSDSSSLPIRLQSNVIRSNCMDCLDRTNVVQAAIAKRSLTLQLRELGVLVEKDHVDNHEEFMAMFRNVWADHANFISRSYSGTHALKTDFTRTGKRTKQGLWNDFVSSVKRYVMNNFFDGERQDGFDLVTGAWTAADAPAARTSLQKDIRPTLVKRMPDIAVVSFCMTCAALYLPLAFGLASTTAYLIVWMSIFVLSIMYIFNHGIEYVAWPQLIPPASILNYDGPGARTTEHGRGKMFIDLSRLPLPRWVRHNVNRFGLGSGGSRRIPVSILGKLDEIEMGRKRRVD